MERLTFKTQRVATVQQKTTHLRQHCQEMQDGVVRAQQHNRQLLQQFQEAEDTLREMFTLTAAMKTTRMEYEKYLMGISQWRQQLQENTQERRNLSNTEDQPLPSTLSRDGSFHSPHIPSSWMMQATKPLHPQDSPAPPHVPSNPALLLHQASVLSLHQSLPCQNVPDLAWMRPASVAGIPTGSEPRSCTTEPPAESRQQSLTSSAPGSCRRSTGSRSSHSALELDTHPVRLPCSAESTDSTTESSQRGREKRRKSKRTSREGERRSSSDSQVSSEVRTGLNAAANSGSVTSSEVSRSTRKSAGSEGGLLKVENGVQGRKDKKNEASQTSSEESRCEHTDGEDSGSQRGSPGTVDLKMKNEYLSSTSEEVKGDEGLQEEVRNEEDESDKHDVRDEEEQDRKENVSERDNTTGDDEEDAGAEEEEETEEQGSEEDRSEGLKDEDNRQLDSASSQEEADEDESEDSQDLSEEDEASDKYNTQDSSCDEEEDEMEVAEEKKGVEVAEESDSDDCIIPKPKSKQLHIIPEEAPEDEDEEEAQPGNSGEDSDEFSDDVEDLLEPQKQPKIQETVKPEQKPPGFRARMEIFQVETDEGSSHKDHPTDSDEFDHFFD